MDSVFNATATQDQPPTDGLREAEEELAPPVEESTGTLSMLRGAVAQRVEAPPETVEVPDIPLRLICSTDIESRQITSWQRKALPPQLRNASQVSPLAMDQANFNASVLINTCLRIEVKSVKDGAWRAITDEQGNVLTLADKAVWAELGALDSRSTVKKMFGRDADLMRAGQKVLNAAGWTENRLLGLDEDTEDPTN
jgi:hypothetical protein